MPASSPLEVLADELGAIAGRIERDSELRIKAALASAAQREAERDLRMERLERDVRARLAELKDGDPGEPGKSITLEDVAPLIAGEVERVVAAMPAPEKGKDADPLVIERMVSEEVAKIPAAKDGASIEPQVVADLVANEVSKAVALLPVPERGKDADPTLIERMVSEAVAKLPPAERGKDADPETVAALVTEEVSRAVAALPVPTNGRDADLLVIERLVSEAVAKIPAAKDGASVTVEDVASLITDEVNRAVSALPKPENGTSVTIEDVRPLIVEEVAKIPVAKEGPPGKLPIIKVWTDRVYYEGEAASHDGSTYQALRDTGREPPHEDWQCIAATGRNGEDGRTPEVCGTFDPERKDYRKLDIVALNGASFIAKRDNPGACPGDGWQLSAAQGKRGQPGEPGKRGEPGGRGDAGPPVVSMDANDQGVVTLTNGDGSTVDLDLYPLLSKVQR